jgi:hypothetical protein
MTVEKTFQGAWRVSEVINNQLCSKQYFDYTRAEAVAAFNLYYHDQINPPAEETT